MDKKTHNQLKKFEKQEYEHKVIGFFHFNNNTNKWGRYKLDSPEFDNLDDLIKWNSADRGYNSK